MGADAFAVATLEEAIALRKAFQESAGAQNVKLNKLSSLFSSGADENMSIGTIPTAISTLPGRARNRRPPYIRILVLGPPVGFPRCFDDYFHHNIEVMISGPEVAKALYQWANDPEERKRNIVERSASESKELALKGHAVLPPRTIPNPISEHRESIISDSSTGDNSQSSEGAKHRYHPPSATLGNVTGSDLAKEVRKILKNQQQGVGALASELIQPPRPKVSGSATPQTMESSGITPESSEVDLSASNGGKKAAPFAGIEEAARKSRIIQRQTASVVFTEGSDDMDDAGDTTQTSMAGLDINGKPRAPTNRNKHGLRHGGVQRRRLRYHIIVDSGMGRLGLKAEPLRKSEVGSRRDSVEVIKELVDLEVNHECPIEFFGMVTHMADANSTSTYTNDQIKRFRSLLNRVRAAGISVPTISTDNSAALLTTTLNHFDPKELLTQEFADTRGFVRVGGAIYGQRPLFPQLRSVSTLLASVRHVAVLKEGESVGYDRAYVADRNVRIGTLTIGFADGYPRELGNKRGEVAIRGHKYPVVGNICMDMMMVELGDAGDRESPGAQVVVGDTAILWGPGDNEEGDGLVPLKHLAERLGTTQSALTCGLNKERVLRQYV